MAEELTDAEVFGPTHELTDEQAFQGLQPPAVTKEDAMFNRINSGEAPSKLNALPLALRLGIPLGVGTAFAPEGLFARTLFNAALGGGGEAAAQAVEASRGQRSDISPREMLGAGVRNAIPLVNKGPAWVQPIANAAAQGGGAALADLVATGEVNPTTEAAAGVLGAGGTLAQPVITRGGRGAKAAIEAVAGGESLMPALKRGAAEAFRPIVQHPLQQTALATRNEIEKMTGVGGQDAVKIPIAISEAINAPQLTSQMKIPGAELTEDQLNGLSNTALHFAVQSSRENRNSNEIARQVWDVLGAKRDEFNSATAKAIEDYSRRAARAVNDAEAKSRNNFSLLFPPVRAKADIGRDATALVEMSRDEAKKIWDDAYESVRANPAYSQVTVPADPIRDQATALGMDFAKNKDGSISAIAAPAGARNVIQSGQTVGGGKAHPDLLTLDQARSLASDLHRNIRNAGAMPGVDVRARAQLLSTVQDEIQNAVAAHPQLRDALKDANAIYADNIGRFKNSFSKGMLNDAFESGGMLPETIVNRLTGDGAQSYLDQFESIVGAPKVGGNVVGTDLTPDARALAREAFLQTARPIGGKEGSVDLIKAVGKIEQIPKPVRDKLFPNFDVMKDAAKQAGALKEAEAGVANGPHKALEANATDLQQAFGSGDAAAVLGLAKKAVADEAANSAALSALSIKDLAGRDKFDVYKYITDDRNSQRVSQAMGFIDKANPQLGKDVRALYLDSLIEQTGKKGNVDPKALMETLAFPSAKSPNAPGTLGGASRETAEAVLGKPAVDDLRRMSELLGELPNPENITMNEQRGFWNWLILGNEGTSIASKTGKFGLVARTLSLSPALRYRLGSAILTDQNLRRQAMQATGTGLRDVVNRGLGMVTQDLAREYGWSSPQVRDAEQARGELLNPGH